MVLSQCLQKFSYSSPSKYSISCTLTKLQHVATDLIFRKRPQSRHPPNLNLHPPSPVSSLNHWTISASETRLPVQKHNKDFCFWLLITQRTIRITRPSPLFLFNIYLDLSPLYDIFYYLCHRHTMAKLVRFIPLELVRVIPCVSCLSVQLNLSASNTNISPYEFKVLIYLLSLRWDSLMEPTSPGKPNVEILVVTCCLVGITEQRPACRFPGPAQ